MQCLLDWLDIKLDKRGIDMTLDKVREGMIYLILSHAILRGIRYMIKYKENNHLNLEFSPFYHLYPQQKKIHLYP